MKQTGGVWALEEATGLLRALPARSWVVWLLGTLPFTWALVEFFLEMSASAFAAERLAGMSVGLAFLYVIKHVGQGLFSWDCLRVMRGERVALPGWRAVARLALVQAAWQPWRMPALLVASVAIIPVPWVAAFLRNVGLAAVERERGFVREAWRLGRGDTRAHSNALLILSLCWLMLFVNLLALWFVAPMLLKAFFGWQTEMVRLAGRVFNATTVLVTMVVAFAALEPVAGAMAAVRAFYAEARTSGADLRAGLRRAAAGLVMAALLAGSVGAQTVEPGKLDRQVDEVLRDAEFAWKLPAAEKAKDEGSGAWLRDLFRTVARWGEWIYEMYKKLFPDDPAGAMGAGGRWSVNADLVRWAMIGAGALAAGCLLWILLARRKEMRKKAAAGAVAVASTEPVDLRDENVSAAELVEDEWLRMADEMAARGEYRLATRAVHLAGLRYLGEKGLVTLQPAKTGREYGGELARRLRDVPEAIAGYGQGLRLYERVWYGFGTAGAESYQALRGTWEEMRRYA